MSLNANPSYVESLLKKFGVQNVRSKKDGFMACCPFHEERHPSFSISDSGLWMCWTCKEKGNLRTLIRRLGGGEMDWRDTLRVMGNQLENSPYEIVESRARRKNGASRQLPSDFKPYATMDEVPEKISTRLRWDTIHHFGLGASDIWPYKDRCVIPIRFKDKVVGYHGRALRPDIVPKYRNPSEFRMKDHVFNYDECAPKKEVIVVEGAFNAMSMWEKGFPHTMAFFGTQFTAGQIKRLFALSPDSVVICFDRDPSKIKDGVEKGRGGQRATKTLGSIISQVIPVYVMPLPLGKDPNDLPAEALTSCYENKISYERLFGGGNGI